MHNPGNRLVWFRTDLRVTDHPALYDADEKGIPCLGIYCFNPSQYKQLPEGFPKTGNHRAQFLLESVYALKKDLQALGSDLLVFYGSPHEVIPDVIRQLSIKELWWQEEICHEEKQEELALQKAISNLELRTQTYWTHTLVDKIELPFELDKLPNLFTQFRIQVEKQGKFRESLPAPKALRGIAHSYKNREINLAVLGLPEVLAEPRAAMDYGGGFAAAIIRIQHYFFQSKKLAQYKETRNGLLGADFSSKLSPWLAAGCISNSMVYQAVKKFEQENFANDSTYWLIFELLWRDYFKFVALKFGNAMFHSGGLFKQKTSWKKDDVLFQKWKEGKTGIPFLDANMRELLHTGFMSNRGRQNVANWLSKHKHIDWRLGAAWFESRLIDYDPCSNYGNWAYVAGVGNDARENRMFNLELQAQRYDPNGAYIKYWL